MRKYCKTVTDKKGETKIHEVTTTTLLTQELHVSLCDEEGFNVQEELLINYMDLRSQVMVLDISDPVSLAGSKWLEQYLEEFDLTIEEMDRLHIIKSSSLDKVRDT